jgi:hypothetical protein
MTPDPWEHDADRVAREGHNAYMRDYMRRRRAKRWENAIGSLHALDCDGQHRRGRKGCVPVPVYTREAA